MPKYPHACICIQICQLGVAAQALTYPETGPAKFVSKQHQIGTAPVCCAQQNFTGVQESTHQHPAPAAINQPGGLVPGQEPAPSYPPVPSPPEFQSLGSPETTEKEIGTVSPMRVRSGNMLGKGCGVGRIAASVVQWARAVPLGISHDLRWVGGLCALNGTSVGGRLAPSRSGSRAWVDS